MKKRRRPLDLIYTLQAAGRILQAEENHAFQTKGTKYPAHDTGKILKRSYAYRPHYSVTKTEQLENAPKTRGMWIKKHSSKMNDVRRVFLKHKSNWPVIVAF